MEVACGVGLRWENGSRGGPHAGDRATDRTASLSTPRESEQMTEQRPHETATPSTAAPVRGVDTTGAGDTFSGTLAARIAANPARDPETLLGHIAAAAAATARLLAARVPTESSPS